MAQLRITSGSLSGQEIDLDMDLNVIGRSPSNQIAITDPGVSSKHAKIWAENGRWWIMDLGSTNGTLVNNADIDREELNDGDKLSFGPVHAVFVSATKRSRPGPSLGRQAPPPAAPPPAPVVASGPSAPELELELATLNARYATLEQEMERQRQQFAEAERGIAEHAVKSMRAEMEKLRELMRERDESMRTIEAQMKEREAYYSPEELEREKKRVEAGIMLDARRQIDTFERQVKELESKLASRIAEAEALARTNREKDDLVRLLSDREDRAVGALREKDDRIAELGASAKRLEDELAAANAREREASDKLKQKNVQLAELGQQQAMLTQELSKSRAAAARVSAGDSAAAAEQAVHLAAELDQTKQEVLKLRAQVNAAQDEIITARSAREQETAKAASVQKTVDELQGQVTDLTDEKSRLELRVDELLKNHTQMAELERMLAGRTAELALARHAEADARARAQKADEQAAMLKKEKLDLASSLEAMQRQFDDVKSDYGVLRGSHDTSLDWEARYKSQIDDFESMKKKAVEYQQTIEALQAQVGTAAAGTVDDATLTYAKARTTMLEQMAGGMLEGINNAVSLLRRNSEVLKGYVHDCGLLASCVRQINYTLLEPEQQRMLRELIDETQPDVIIRNMEGIGDENDDATKRAKRLILDYQEAMKADEDGTDLERCFAKSQGLFAAVEPGSEVRVKVSKALPALPTTQPEGVLFAFALLREAKALAVDEDQLPRIQVDPQGDVVTIMVSPVHPKAKERVRETLQGGGDARIQYVVGYARQACKGRIDVKDMANACTMFITLNAK